MTIKTTLANCCMFTLYFRLASKCEQPLNVKSLPSFDKYAFTFNEETEHLVYVDQETCEVFVCIDRNTPTERWEVAPDGTIGDINHDCHCIKIVID